jgi:glycosyltransferase involved in cell wall biosynthesis
MIQLGMPAERIFTGYNMVDNEFFISQSDLWRENRPDSFSTHRVPYFLASNRFIHKKNLFFLLDAYAGYVKGCSPSSTSSPLWPLVLLGDGELREPLLQHARKLGLDIQFTAPWEGGEVVHSRGCVYFPGFRQVNELPRFYAGAGAFVHASLSEQWGLVVNEAMASELPVLVSKPCGCAIDLVKEGENGYTFVLSSPSVLTELLLEISLMDSSSRKKMGQRGRSIISDWGAERFAEGFRSAAEAALKAPPKGAKIFARLLLEVFCRRLMA